jgi:hypothetical protein
VEIKSVILSMKVIATTLKIVRNKPLVIDVTGYLMNKEKVIIDLKN